MKSKKNRSKTKENERQKEPNRCQKQIKWQKWTANLLCFKIWKRAMIIINYISYSRKCYFVSHRTYDRNKTDFHADALETQKSTEKSTEEWPNRIGLCTEREWTKTKQKWSKGEREKNHLEWKNMKEEKRDCAQTKPTKRGKKNGKATGQHKSVQFSWVELTWDSAKRLNRKKDSILSRILNTLFARARARPTTVESVFIVCRNMFVCLWPVYARFFAMQNGLNHKQINK